MSARRTILFYTHALSGGGAERAWSLLASGLARRGHEVVFAVDYESEQNLTYVVPGVRIVPLGGGHAATAWKLARLIRRLQPDVTISALCFSNLKHLVAASLAGRLDRTVIAYHSFAGGEPQFLSRLSYLLTPLQARMATRTIAVSDALRTDLVARWNCPPDTTARIYNPVVWGEADPALSAADLKARAPLVLASGRLVEGKNFRLLLQAFARLPNDKAKLAILGEGPKRDELEAEVRRLNLSGRVDLPGYIAEPWTYYRRASCLVSPSRSESFGMVIVEALAHGLPIITTPTLGAAEIVAQGQFGTLVPYDDVEALARALDASLSDPGDPRLRMERALDFAPDVALESYEALIEEIVAKACPAGVTSLVATR